MKISFSARKFEATEKLQAFTEAELNRLERFYEGPMTAEIVLEESGNLKTAEIRLKVLNTTLIARMDGNDFYKIVPKVVEKLERQLKDLKTKIQDR